MTCEHHDPWMNDPLLTPDYRGGGWLMGVHIGIVRECRRCGHEVTWEEALEAAMREQAAEQERLLSE